VEPRWQAVKTLGISEKLNAINEQLQVVIPQLVEAQVRSLEQMARTAVTAEHAKGGPT